MNSVRSLAFPPFIWLTHRKSFQKLWTDSMSASSASCITAEHVMTPAEIKRLQTQSDTDTLVAAFHRDQLRWSNVDWVVAVFLIAVHAGALAAPFFFSWTGLAVCLVMHWVTCSLGICLGYHRFLAHKSMKLRAPAEFVAMACGCLSGEGSPMTWAATHRLHHHKSDHEGDPHSPVKETGWWSHILWVLPKRSTESGRILFRRYVPELMDRPMMKFFEKTFALWLWGGGLTMLAAGWIFGGWRLGRFSGCVGHVRSNGRGLSQHLVCQFSHSSLGLSQLRHTRSLTQPVVGGHSCLWRRLAQQSSRSPSGCSSGTQVVGSGYHLVVNSAAASRRPGLRRERPDSTGPTSQRSRTTDRTQRNSLGVGGNCRLIRVNQQRCCL